MKYAKTSPLYLTRFVAAYMVLLYHYSPESLRKLIPGIKNFAEPVNYFFFISGFVMIVSSKKCLNFTRKHIDLSKADFWVKRVARIYPMYLLALLLFVLFNYAIKEIDPSIPKRIWFETLGVQRWIYKGGINFPDWTVSCEFLFYLLFPFTLPWIVKFSFKKIALITLSLYAVNIIFTFYFNQLIRHLQQYNPSHLIAYLSDSILLHPIFKYTIFLFGCLCGRFYLTSSIMSSIERFSLCLFIVSLLLIVIVYKYDIVSDILLKAGLLCPVYFLFVLAICSFKGLLLQMFSWYPFIFLGEISYSIYILQAAIAHYFEYFFLNGTPIATITQFLSYTLFLILLSSVLYYVYEIPLKKWIINYYKYCVDKRYDKKYPVM